MSSHLIELVLCDPGAPERELSLWFRLRQTPIAAKYFSALRECQELSFLDPDRFYSFPHSHRDRAWIADAINRYIDVINDYRPGLIQHRAQPHMDQTLMNHLHVYFEVHRGPILKPAAFYASAPPAVQRALEDFNLAIHRYERFEFSESEFPTPQLMVTFDYRRPRYQLADEDYTEFTTDNAFGGWYINYCDVGKTLWDLFKDKDDVIGDQNINPLRYYSGDAMVVFVSDRPEYEARMLVEFSEWWDANRESLARLGFEKGDPRNAIGSLPVADLDRSRGAVAGLTEPAICDLIGRHQLMVRVACH